MTHIVVCGNSLYLDGVIEGLRSQSAISITHIDLRCEAVVKQIVMQAPDAVIVEVEAQAPAGQMATGQVVFALLQHGFPVLVLDLEESSITVIEGRRTPAGGLADLTQVIATIGMSNGHQGLMSLSRFDEISVASAVV